MKKKIKCEKQIMILSITAVVYTVFASMRHLFEYEPYMRRGKVNYKMTFCLPDFGEVLYWLISIIPSVLLLMYVSKFYKQRKTTVIYPIICGIIVVWQWLLPLGFGGLVGLSYNFISWIGIVVSFLLLTINGIMGLEKKACTITATSLGIASQLLWLVQFFAFGILYSDGYSLWMWCQLMELIGTTSLYIALYLYSLNNRIPALVSRLSHEEPLRILKDRLDYGEITEEDYRKQRAKIVSEL